MASSRILVGRASLENCRIVAPNDQRPPPVRRCARRPRPARLRSCWRRRWAVVVDLCTRRGCRSVGLTLLTSRTSTNVPGPPSPML